MTVIIDECLPRRLMNEIEADYVTTVPKRGWAGKKNGELLALIGKEFDVFVTIDGGIENQQNLSTFPVGIVALDCISNRFEDIKPLIPGINTALKRVRYHEMCFMFQANVEGLLTRLTGSVSHAVGC